MLIVQDVHHFVLLLAAELVTG